MDPRGLVVSLREAGAFATGSADLSLTARAVLAQVAQSLSEVGNGVRVEGHTDDVPIHTVRYRSNWELSTERATNVVALLLGAGVHPRRLSAAGYGEFHPRVANDGDLSRARNRRVDIVILNREGRPGARSPRPLRPPAPLALCYHRAACGSPLLQLNPTVGGSGCQCGQDRQVGPDCRGVDLCVSPEMSLVGYPPRDLLLEQAFVTACRLVLDRLASDLRDAPPVLVGAPVENPARDGRPLFNAAVLLRGGRVERIFRKTLLPTYDVFDEDRYFEPGPGGSGLLDAAGCDCAVSICEDIWNDRDFWHRRRYHRDPIAEARDEGADLVINMSASPFAAGKQQFRERMLGSLAQAPRPACRSTSTRSAATTTSCSTGAASFVDAEGPVSREGPRLRARTSSWSTPRLCRPSTPRTRSPTSRRSTRRSCWAPATTRASAASRERCWDCQAASTAR